MSRSRFSSEQFSDRFELEARAIAALNHPNICQLYDVGPNYLVMELIEGEALTSLIKTGPCRSIRRFTTRGKSPARSRRRTSEASSIATARERRI
jgi:serine/threonine protein kinase